MNWQDKHIIITGGTSGLGLGLVTHFLEAGAHVATFARSSEKIKELKKKFPTLVAFTADISDKHQIHATAATIFSTFDKVDLLVNNASALGPMKLLIDTECEELEEVLQTNVVGLFRFTKLILQNMILNENGTIINISSDAAVSAYPTWGSYGISKAALDQLSNILAVELENYPDIAVKSLDPGDMNTPMHLTAIPDANIDELKNPMEVAKEIKQFIEHVDQVKGQTRLSASTWRAYI